MPVTITSSTNQTNLEAIFDCLEALYKSIKSENGFRSAGLLVDRAKDPRLLQQNMPVEYEKYHRAITIVRAGGEQDERVSVSGRERWKITYNLLCLATLTTEEDAAGKKLDGIVADMLDDIRMVIRADQGLKTCATDLGITPWPWNCNHRVERWMEDKGVRFPDTHFVVVCSFLIDERYSGTA